MAADSENPTVTLAKLAGIQKVLRGRLASPAARYFDPLFAMELLEAAGRLLETLRQQLPTLFGDLPSRKLPQPQHTTDNEGRGYIERPYLAQVLNDIDYIFEVRAHSELASPTAVSSEQRVFISHGRASDWREVQAYIEKDLEIATLELAQEPNLGRTVLQKLEGESRRCMYAVVVMTGDDMMADGELRTRENVMHEIGYLQAKFGLANVSLLHEEGTNVPSNIHGLVYIPFPPGTVSATFGVLTRELKAAFR